MLYDTILISTINCHTIADKIVDNTSHIILYIKTAPVYKILSYLLLISYNLVKRSLSARLYIFKTAHLASIHFI